MNWLIVLNWQSLSQLGQSISFLKEKRSFRWNRYTSPVTNMFSRKFGFQIQFCDLSVYIYKYAVLYTLYLKKWSLCACIEFYYNFFPGLEPPRTTQIDSVRGNFVRALESPHPFVALYNKNNTLFSHYRPRDLRRIPQTLLALL